MILSGSAIQNFIRVAGEKSSSISIAAPFWGEQAIEILGLRSVSQKLHEFKLICNLESGACNPMPIRQLQGELDWDVRTNKRLHAKVYIFDDLAIVGSANPSANGLAMEDTEQTSWHEICVVISDGTEVDKLRNWFDHLFESHESKIVSAADLVVADSRWNDRRKAPGSFIKNFANGASLQALSADPNSAAINESTWLWIYFDQDVSIESENYITSIKQTYTNLYEYPYEVESNPQRYRYDSIIDCSCKRKRNGSISVSVSPWRIYPKLAHKITQGESKGWWTLPCSKIGKSEAEGKSLDQDSILWIVQMVRMLLERNPALTEEEISLKDLIIASAVK